MLELDQLVVAKITADAQLISLMGITAEDDRVYAWYPISDIIYTINELKMS